MFEDDAFVGKLKALERRYEELGSLLGQPDVIQKRDEFAKLSKEHAELEGLVEAWRAYGALAGEIADAEALERDGDADDEMRALARDELTSLRRRQQELEERIRILLLPKDPNDGKNIILEIRAGTGGDEAALFGGDLFRMYMRYAESRGWKTEVLTMHEGPSGGIKEVVVLIEGKDVYSQLKYESGVHRVQRVPATESSGRIHTSAATVVVLPEAEEVDVRLDDKDLRIDVMRAGGPGGQSVNTTDSAVRITHIETGLVVICQDEKSQHKNKAKALRILRSRLLDLEVAKKEAEERDQRRALVKTGDRSEKVRTYNFPQDRMTDHRIGYTAHGLSSILGGSLDDVVNALQRHYQAEALNAAKQ